MATHDRTTLAAWERYRVLMTQWHKGGRRTPAPPQPTITHDGVGSNSTVVEQRSSARLLAKGSCPLWSDSLPLALGHVVGPLTSTRYAHSNLHWCRALQQPSVLAGTVSTPRHIRHTVRHIPLLATNPSALSEDLYLVRLTAYSPCSDFKNMPYLTQHDYPLNSVMAVVSKRREAPLLNFTHAEDARAVQVSAHRVWLVYNSWNGLQEADSGNTMWLRRYSWPHLEQIAPPVVLRYAAARRREKNWIPFVTTPQAGTRPPHVLFTYQLEPHVVLSCRPADGECRKLYHTSAMPLWQQRIRSLALPLQKTSRQRVPISAGTPCVSLAGAPTCMAHVWVPQGTQRVYLHLWYALSPEPPFAVRYVSQPFRFAAHFNDGRDNIQCACCGLEPKHPASAVAPLLSCSSALLTQRSADRRPALQTPPGSCARKTASE